MKITTEMGNAERLKVYELARSLMPRTTPELATLMVDAVKNLPLNLVCQAIKNHAQTEPEGRLSIHWIKCEINRLQSPVRELTIEEKRAAAKERADAVAAERQALFERSRKEEAAAREFCAAHADRLEEWKAELIAKAPFLGKVLANKSVLDSPTMCSAIYLNNYTKFGKIPVEGGL